MSIFGLFHPETLMTGVARSAELQVVVSVVHRVAEELSLRPGRGALAHHPARTVAADLLFPLATIFVGRSGRIGCGEPHRRVLGQ